VSHLFDDRARDYARTRPTYPDRLFDHLAALAPERGVVWDCGAGSGQAARSLVGRFERVVATDISRVQIGHLSAGPRLHPVVAAAEQSPLRNRSVDLVTVSAALHWFDRPRFYAEVARVARPGAVIAVWSYFRTHITPDVDAIIDRYADELIAEYWLPQFGVNRSAYRDLDFPFERLPWLEVEAQAHLSLGDLLDFMRTWSASQAWTRERGGDPVEKVRADLERAWGDPAIERLARWPLHGAIGRVP
jgi:ubiquinone/menaquinone biosynthesis C-methylase UbiE